MTKLNFFRPVAWGVLLGLILTTAFAFKALRDKPSCAISINKQNVFYIGVDNPVTIVVRGVPAEQVVLKAEGVVLKNDGEDNYIVRATTPGEAIITVSGGDLPPTSFRYRVKRIPDPVVMLGMKYRGKSMPNGEFKAQGGLSAVLENFDFDARCNVVRYEVTYLPKRQDPVTRINVGARFNQNTQEFINKAQPGDSYFFDDIKVQCPGDISERNLGALAFRIK
jgi:hypothetical protein